MADSADNGAVSEVVTNQEMQGGGDWAAAKAEADVASPDSSNEFTSPVSSELEPSDPLFEKAHPRRSAFAHVDKSAAMGLDGELPKKTYANASVPPSSSCAPPGPVPARPSTLQTSMHQQSMQEDGGDVNASVVNDEQMEAGGDCSALKQGVDGASADSSMELSLEAASELGVSDPLLPEAPTSFIRSPDNDEHMLLDIEDDIPEELRLTNIPEGGFIVGDLGDDLGYLLAQLPQNATEGTPDR